MCQRQIRALPVLEQHIDVCDKLVRYDALVVVSTGMRAVKLCTNKILQFLTEGAG